ncbi:MAG: PilW family protein [Rhodoferax sp.]|uniref:PilW family protein n=1 Tax=Rhodoferax sp. TaxID=50421 RepID=UPI0026114C4E|nr:PilW family protein [Rhodoferax sp.]MDD2879026.1 PilW family protein [Rhodoferax sp.]
MNHLKPYTNQSGVKCITAAPRQRRYQRGLTLIELMISLVLGLVIVGGVLNIFISTNQTAKVNDNLMRIQENARTAFDLMARDIREAGLNPCGVIKVVNVIRVSGAIPWWSDWNGGTIRGYDGADDTASQVGFGTAANTRVSGTDALTSIHTATDQHVITSHADTEIDLATVTGLAADDIALACDGLQAALFQIGTVGAGSWKHISYDKDFAPLNCTNSLDTNVACTTSANKIFSANGSVSKLVTSFWYVGHNAQGQRSLFRTMIKSTNTSVTNPPDEMIPGVQDLQITYLTRDGTTGILANNWVAADSITNWTDDNTTAQVVAVRIDLTLQTSDNVSTSQTPIQRHLIHVVGLRNRDTFIAP